MSHLVQPVAFPAMRPESIEKVRRFEDVMRELPQHPIHTQHIFHAGMYARTIKLIENQYITGALIKRATLLILHGKADVFTGDAVEHFDGYHVLSASAGRKQVFRAHGDTYLTMVFPTSAQSVDEAEREFTNEHELLVSHIGENDVLMTGE